VEPPTPFVFDLAPGIDWCGNPTGLDLDVTFGAALEVTAWAGDATVAHGVLSAGYPIGSAKSPPVDGTLGDPFDPLIGA
jgi:hypothetical protein